MPSPGRSIVITLFALALSFASLPVSATAGDGQDSEGAATTGCINIEYDHWGGPLILRPYAEETIGFLFSEDSLSDGLTLAVLIVPSHCGPSAAVESFGGLITTRVSLPTPPPVPSKDAGLTALP